MYTLKEKKSNNTKLIVIIVLAVLLAAESCLCIFLGIKKGGAADTDALSFSLELDTAALGSEIAGAVSRSATDMLDGIEQKVIPMGTINAAIRSVIYSDAIVNAIMSISYPLLYDTLTSLELMDFAENVALYPTGPQLAKLMEGKGCTAVDKDGTRKDLTDVLNAVGSDWTYMNEKVTFTKADGTAVTTTIWNSVEWGVNDKASFYTAMQNMSEGLRGVLEITIQHKQKVVNINPVDYLLGFDKINVRMDAATVYSAAEQSGYAMCLIPLFNMLGLRPGEYPEDAAVCAYENLGDIWQAILEPVLTAVDKALADPMTVLPDMLVNFIKNLESGALKESMLTLRMDGDYAELASLAMGYEDGLIFNLGDALLQIIGSMGIDLNGNFNGVLDSLLGMITKKESADMPDMDTARLCEGATAETLSNGSTVYHADSQNVISCLVDYVIAENTVSLVLNQTPLAGTQAAADITAAVGQSRDGLRSLASVIVGLVLEKLTPAA